jgi:hypothetical protein
MIRLKNWNKFISENLNINELKYYIFDWDDNILEMHTPLHFQHFENGRWISKDITTHEFAQIRKKYPSNYMDNIEWKGDVNYSFIEFRDHGPRGENAFIEDIKNSIKLKSFGPSWKVFLNVLKKGNLFAIVTTRGHEPSTIRAGVRYIIDNVLTTDEKVEMLQNIDNFNKMFNIKTDGSVEQYLNSCYFIGLFSKAFQEEFGYVPYGDKLNIGKQDAINKFVNYVRQFSQQTKLPLKIGFSDDDINFSNAAKELFMSKEKSLDFKENFYVFDTSNRELSGGVKLKI